MLRYSVFTLLFLLPCVSMVQAQGVQDTSGIARSPLSFLDSQLTLTEVQAKMTKLRSVLEEIAKLELAMAISPGEESEQANTIRMQSQKKLERLWAEKDATRSEIAGLWKSIPDEFSSLLLSGLNAETRLKDTVLYRHKQIEAAGGSAVPNSDSLGAATSKSEGPTQVSKVVFERMAAKQVADLLLAVMDDSSDRKRSLGFDVQANAIVLCGDKSWIVQMHKLIEALDGRLALSVQSDKSDSRGTKPQQALVNDTSNQATRTTGNAESQEQVLAVRVEYAKAKLIADLIWGVLGKDARQDLSVDERANLIVLRGEKQWIENARTLIVTLDRCSSSK